MDNLEIEVKAHDEIASMCFAAGIETPDGTSVGAVKSALAELARLRAERDELRTALNTLVSAIEDDDNEIPMSMRIIGKQRAMDKARAIISRTEGGHE